MSLSVLELIKNQREIEAEGTMLGVERAFDKLSGSVKAKREAESLAGQRLIDKYMLQVMTALQNALDESKKVRRKPLAIKPIQRLGVEMTAYLTLKLVLNGLVNEKNLNATAISLGKAIHLESISDEIREHDEEAYKKLAKATTTLANRGKARNATFLVEAYAKETLDQYEDLPNKKYAAIGLTLITILMNNTDLVEETTVIKKGKTIKKLIPTKATVTFIKETSTLSGISSPIYPLMVCPPKRWESVYRGAYLTDTIKNCHFAKVPRKILEEMDTRWDSMQPVVNAVNTAQETAWKLDSWIYDLINNLEEAGMLDKVGVDLNSISEEAFFRQLMGTAKRFLPYDKVYVPYQVDFRGRLYAIPTLNPQGADWTKALFRFAEGEPIEEIEEYWALAVHVANVAGFDKASFEGRVQWAEENLSVFWDYLADPMNNLGWMEADKPLQFLQAIRDFVGFHVHGWGYKSSVPVALDGSCSGIQHFGAMTRDAGTCGQVNLVPNEKPDDIYQSVADKVKELMVERIGEEALSLRTRDEVVDFYLNLIGCTKDNLEKELEDKDFRKEFYQFTETWGWLKYGITRKLCKRSVMTFAYGSGEYGYGEQVMEDTLSRIPLSVAVHFFHVGEHEVEHAKRRADSLMTDVEDVLGTNKAFYASKVLAHFLNLAIKDTVSKPVEAMTYIQGIARETAKNDMPVKWVTPTGFVVVQDYRKTKRADVQVITLGERRRLIVQENLSKVDPKASANGASPNFVHSMDASHLVQTVNTGKTNGINSWALVHDSFGTHAKFAPDVFVIVRHEMVELYECFNVLEALKVHNIVPDDLPPIEYGDYNLEQIMDADYAFA